MGINVSTKTKAKATLKLYNQISSYLFEQEYDELKGNPSVIHALQVAKGKLMEIVKKNQ